MDYDYEYDREQIEARSLTAHELSGAALGEAIAVNTLAVADLAHRMVEWLKHGVQVMTSRRSHS